MQLSEDDIHHLKRALAMQRRWHALRWILAALLANLVIAHLADINPLQRTDLLVLGTAALVFAWRGLCGASVLYTLHRLASCDPQAREQLIAAGIHSFAAEAEAASLLAPHERS